MAGICKFSAFLESCIPQVYSNGDRFLWFRTLEIFFFRIVVFIPKLDESLKKRSQEIESLIKKNRHGTVDGNYGLMSDFSHSLQPWENNFRRAFSFGIWTKGRDWENPRRLDGVEGERAGLPFCQTRGVRIWLFRHGQQVSQSLQPLYPKAWRREPGEDHWENDWSESQLEQALGEREGRQSLPGRSWSLSLSHKIPLRRLSETNCLSPPAKTAA